eukprot:bmy_06371T0
MGTQKPRILPWLVSQLDQGQLEGVAWLDESRTRFRIPWKHGLRQDAQLEDFGIFQAWAEASGAYTPGKDKPDLPTWKRNFRSALNRKEALRLAEDHSKDPHDPHKIYEFVTSGVGDLSEPDTSLDTNGRYSTSDIQEDILEKLLSDMDLAPDGGPPSLTMAPENPPQLLLSPNLDVPAPCPKPGPPENPLKQLLVSEEEWEFEVTVFYRGCQVFQQTVFCPGGLRLVGSEAGDRTLPGQPIRLPDPAASLTDRGVTGYVQRVLSCLGGGLALWRAGQWLCAQRLGHCHVYWAVGEELLPSSGHRPDGSWAPRSDCLHRRKQTLTTLHSLVLRGAVMAPGPTMDQEARDGQVPSEKLQLLRVSASTSSSSGASGVPPTASPPKPILRSPNHVEVGGLQVLAGWVVPMCLRALLDMARVGGASSLENTVDLHISNSHPLSLTSDQYKAYLQDLVEDMDF